MIAPDLFLDTLTADLEFTFPELHGISPVQKLGDGWGSIAVEARNHNVFRIAKNGTIQKQYKQQVKVLPFLATKLKEIEIPFPKYFVESSERFPYGVMGYKKIEGSILNPQNFSTKDLVNLASKMARLLLQFHSIKITDDLQNIDLPKADYSEKKLQKTWKSASRWLKNNLTDDEYSKAVSWLENTIVFFETYNQKQVFVHGDPWYENIIIDEDGNIKGIVDFDRIGIADKAIDFVVQQYISTEFMQMVIQQYQNFGGELGNDFEKRVALLSGMKRLEDLNYCLEIGYIYPNVLDEIKKNLVV